MDSKIALRATIAALFAGTLAACSTLPPQDPAIEDARAAHDAARDNPNVQALAPGEYRRADEDFHRAENAWLKNENRAEVDHLAYIAKRRAEIAMETARLKASEATIASATVERDRIRLEARTREAYRAQREAQLAEMRADLAQRQALEARRNAAIAEQQATISRSETVIVQQQAAESRAMAQALATQLADLQAQTTDRGVVITLGDVLFDTGSARLREPGVRAVDRLAAFMRQYPRRNVAIEGFTDNVGSESYNWELSERRAETVRNAIIAAGIAPERLTVRAYGQAYPVASNSDVTGRQLNRRVEVVISDDDGRIPPRDIARLSSTGR